MDVVASGPDSIATGKKLISDADKVVVMDGTIERSVEGLGSDPEQTATVVPPSEQSTAMVLVGEGHGLAPRAILKHTTIEQAPTYKSGKACDMWSVFGPSTTVSPTGSPQSFEPVPGAHETT